MTNKLWADAAAYESYVGRWSRPVASRFVDGLGVPAGRRWLDVGCGTGALSSTVLEHADPAGVTGIDPSERFVAYAREHVTDPRVSFDVGDARELPYPDGAFDAVVSGLVLNFVPEPERALAEFVRVAAPGATVAAYVWDYAAGMRLMWHFWQAAAELDPAAAKLDEGRRFPVCRPEPLVALWTAAGLDGVTVEPVDVPTPFRDFDDYWAPFLTGVGPAPGYASALPEPARDALRERLRERLPYDEDGAIRLAARAWAVSGRR